MQKILFIILTFFVSALSTQAQDKGIILNEVSQGTGEAEYIELLVVGCPGGGEVSKVDENTVGLRGWIVDDNNGDFSDGPKSGAGISTSATVTVTATGLIIPNVFSPNDDGVNDIWEIHHSCDYPEIIVKVFNRWGNAVFESTGYNQPWDGTYNGKKVPTGTYYYIIDPNDDSTKPVKGSVVITY